MENQFKDQLPYDYRNMEQAGKYRGVGQAGKVGIRKGTFTDTQSKEKRLKDEPPPRKMN
jgi:hypothetical protein